MGYSKNRLRPTSSKLIKTINDLLKGKIEKKICIDLFAGTGKVGISFLEQNAEKVYFAEKDKNTVKQIYRAIEKIRIDSEKYRIYNCDFKIFLKRFRKLADIIYIDPPYERTEYYRQAFDMIKAKGILAKQGMIIFETNKFFNYKEYEEYIIEKRVYSDTLLIFLK